MDAIFKMADWPESGSESSRVLDYTTLFDYVVGEILIKLDSAKKGDVMDELVEALDMSMLMDVRMKVFRYAKAKLVKTVDQSGNMDIEPAYRSSMLTDTPEDVEKAIGEWSLIARKGKQRVASDAIGLLGYVSGTDAYFPHRLIKKRPNKSKSNRANGKNSKQPLISFKPMQGENENKESSESSSESGDDDMEEMEDESAVQWQTSLNTPIS